MIAARERLLLTAYVGTGQCTAAQQTIASRTDAIGGAQGDDRVPRARPIASIAPSAAVPAPGRGRGMGTPRERCYGATDHALLVPLSMRKTPTPNGARARVAFRSVPSRVHSRDPEPSCGLTVTGSGAWLTSQANWLPSEWTRTSAATRGSSTVTGLDRPGVDRERVVERAGRLGVDLRGYGRQVLERVGAQDQRARSGAAQQQRGPVMAVDGDDLGAVRPRPGDRRGSARCRRHGRRVARRGRACRSPG